MKWQEMGPRLRGDTQKSLERSVSPVEPRAERFDIGGVDGRAAPDAQPRRRVAIARDVVCRAFGFEQAGEFLDEIRIRSGDRQAHRGFRRSEEHTSAIQSLMRKPYAVL